MSGMTIILSSLWGYLALPDYPSMWNKDIAKAFRFDTMEQAKEAVKRWDSNLVAETFQFITVKE